MSDTPKTDLQAHAFGGTHTAMLKGNLIISKCLPVAFSQALERELTAVTAERDALKVESVDMGKQLTWQALEIERLKCVVEDNQMTEEKAREVLGDWIQADSEEIYEAGVILWNPFWAKPRLTGYFTADQLRAIAWWLENKGEL